jgi:hypothetical protein
LAIVFNDVVVKSTCFETQRDSASLMAGDPAGLDLAHALLVVSFFAPIISFCLTDWAPPAAVHTTSSNGEQLHGVGAMKCANTIFFNNR